MEKKIFVITGANRGIGLELTRQALNQGHQVYAGARKASLELRDLADRSSGALRIVDLDVSSDASVKKFAEAIDSDRVDVLINNAGYYADQDTAQTVLDSLNTNAVGPVRITFALMAKLKKGKNPRVANITSQMGSIADNSSGGSLAYRMSKTALNMFTKTLSIDEPNVIVLSLHPGWVQTSMGGARAPLAPQASAEGLLSVIQKSSESDSGKFLTYSGKDLPW